jgi:hypothetical protein
LSFSYLLFLFFFLLNVHHTNRFSSFPFVYISLSFLLVPERPSTFFFLFLFIYLFFFYLFLFLLLCSCTVENTQKSEEQRQRKGGLRWRAAVASTFFWVFFSFLMQLKRKREFLVCLQEQREFEGISAAFKRSDAADFLFFFYYEEPRNEEFEGFAFLQFPASTKEKRRWVADRD